MADSRGPNVNIEDLTASIRDDPMFVSWRDPVPPEWYSANKGAYSIVDQDLLYGSQRFATFVSRSVSETVTTPSDSATRTIIFSRPVSEVLDLPIETVSTSRPPASAIGSSAIGTDTVG